MPGSGSTAQSRITPARWSAVRAAVVDLGARFGALVQDGDPRAAATGQWSVADTAAHVAAMAWCYTALATSPDAPLPVEGIAELVPITTVDNIDRVINEALRRGYTERDPAALVRRLRQSISELLAITAEADPEQTVAWLGGSRLPLAGLLAHLTNELLLYGRDVARALGAPWAIPQEYSALFFELFLVEIIRNGVGNVLDDDRPVRRGRIAVEFRSAHTDPVTLVLDSGTVSAEEPGGRTDVRIHFRPAMLSLVLFHRVGRPRAALTGALRVWGRRPWLLPAFLRKVRLP